MPKDETIQDVFCTRHKHIHTLKIPIGYAVFRQLIYEVTMLAGRTSDLTAWEENFLPKFVNLRHEILGIADKGMNDHMTIQLFAPYEET